MSKWSSKDKGEGGLFPLAFYYIVPLSRVTSISYSFSTIEIIKIEQNLGLFLADVADKQIWPAAAVAASLATSSQE